MIALLAALEEEASGLRREMALAPGIALDLGRSVYAGDCQGQPVLLVVTGMGRQRAETALEAVLAAYEATTVLSIGFSGGLTKRLAAGDLVIASELTAVPEPGGNESEPTVYHADQGLLRAATEALGDARLRVVSGLTVTTPELVSTPAEKIRLGQRTGAVAVDMESYWIAKTTALKGLRFLGLRVISDTLEDRLPRFDQMLEPDGAPRMRQVAAHLMREPCDLLALVRIARNVGRARRALTSGVARTVAVL